jgi:hypothetical protein
VAIPPQGEQHADVNEIDQNSPTFQISHCKGTCTCASLAKTSIVNSTSGMSSHKTARMGFTAMAQKPHMVYLDLLSLNFQPWLLAKFCQEGV